MSAQGVDVDRSDGPVTRPRRRLHSLDIVRGLMLVVSVSVNSLLLTPVWFDHAEWDGVNGLDLVFPVFVTLTGCGLGFAMHRRTEVRSLARRVLVLIGCGLVYNGLTSGVWDQLRFTGVLQLYAGVVALLVLGHLVTRTARGWFVITAVLAAASTTLSAWWAAGCPGGALSRECNPSGVVDPAVFGAAHVYWQGTGGHDPEGLVVLLGATMSAAAGACVGHLLLDRRRGLVLAAAVGLVVLGAGADLVPGVETMKRLWTAPFALFVTAGVALVLLGAHLLLDSERTPRAVLVACTPLQALGRNSLLVYFGSHVLTALLARNGVIEQVATTITVAGQPQLSFTLALVLGWTVLAMVLHRFRVYLRP